jgi:peptide/nickel transport system substrate-binding protein
VKPPHHAARRISLAVLLIALLATSCGSSGDSSEGSAQSVPVSTTEIDREGVLRVGYDLLPNVGGGWSNDPIKLQRANDGAMYLIYGSMLRATLEGELVPDLAESTEIVDANTIDLDLRTGLTFSDGTPFDAQAVKVGLERNLAQGDPAVFTKPFYALSGIDVTGPTSLRLTIDGGTAASWHDTFLPRFQTTITKAEVDPNKPIGAGPFNVTAYQPERSVTLERSETYWDAESIPLGGMEIIHIPWDNWHAQLAALETGQIDLTIADPSQLETLTGDLEPFNQADPNQVLILLMCKKSGPLADSRVRMAINKAIDRDAINEAVYAGAAKPMTTLWPEGHRFHVEDLNDVLSYDVEGARELLAEAGYPNGLDLDLNITTGAGGSQTAEILEQQFAAVGIRSTIKAPADFVNEYLRTEAPGLGLIPGSSRGVSKFDQFNGQGLTNSCKYEDPDLKEIVSELSTVSESSDEAIDLWTEGQDIVVNESLGGFILFRSRFAAYNAERVGSLDLFPSGNLVLPDVRETWMKAKT